MICLCYSPLRLISGLRPGRDQEACGGKVLRLIKIRFTDGQGLEKSRLVVNPKTCDYEIRVPVFARVLMRLDHVATCIQTRITASYVCVGGLRNFA